MGTDAPLDKANMTVSVVDSNDAQISPSTSRTEGPVAPGTIASNSELIGGQHKTTPPSLTDGQQAALQIDSIGNLYVANNYDIIFASETYTTTNINLTARPINGNLAIRNIAAKSIVVKNTGANSATINIKASVDGGVNFDIFLTTNSALAAGSTLVSNNTNAHTHIQILARSTAAGQATTIVTRAYARGV